MLEENVESLLVLVLEEAEVLTMLSILDEEPKS